jgi:NDP-sugar pyrophosphorylase family protein
MPGISLVILAAGMGSRYGGLKQLDGVGPHNETIMDYSVYDAVQAGFDKVIFIIKSSFREVFEKSVTEKYGKLVKLEFAEQELFKIPEGFKLNPERVKPWGTGHAMLMASAFINEPFAVINADDYYGQNSFKVIAGFLEKSKGKSGQFCMVGFRTDMTLSETGGVSRGVCSVDINNILTGVEEHHNIKLNDTVITGTNSEGSEVKIEPQTSVSMNFWGFTPDVLTEGEDLFKEFLATNIDNLTKEFYIPSLVNSLIVKNKAVTYVLNTPDRWFGVTYKEDREQVVEEFKKLTNKGLYPNPLFK